MFYLAGEPRVVGEVSSVHQDQAPHSMRSVSAHGEGQGLVYLSGISTFQPGQLYALGVELLCFEGDTVFSSLRWVVQKQTWWVALTHYRTKAQTLDPPCLLLGGHLLGAHPACSSTHHIVGTQ